ncbi:hypothetical protein AB0C29_00675 [Actinoplanes sp. NPDC048791]|uniref:hypothetical protein n=1 Tax=Actinoplanes sp. NPDC048791 TaxID=3154623 RepID=UPI00340D03EA
MRPATGRLIVGQPGRGTAETAEDVGSRAGGSLSDANEQGGYAIRCLGAAAPTPSLSEGQVALLRVNGPTRTD